MRLRTAVPGSLASIVPVLMALGGCGSGSATRGGSAGVSAIPGPAASGGSAGASSSGGAAAPSGAAGAASGGMDGGDAGVAGSGVAGGASGAGNLPGGVEWEPWPSVPSVSDGICQVTLFRGGDASSPPVVSDLEIREFDPATGIMKRQFAATASLPAEVDYGVFNTQGSPLGGCRVETDPYGCTEWVRDQAGNVTVVDNPAYSGQHFALSNLDAAEFGTRPHGSVEWRYILTYDAAGALTSARNATCCGAPVQTFTEDAQHRCSDVLWQATDTAANFIAGKTEAEHWTWEGDRLVSRVTTNSSDPPQVLSVVTYAYDAEGILSATVVDGYATIPPVPPTTPKKSTPDGSADYVVRSVALPDGSRWVESLDFTTYQPDANVLRNGTLTPASRRRWNYSPGCHDVQPPHRTTTSCQFEPSQNQLEVRWDDPYTTPIRR